MEKFIAIRWNVTDVIDRANDKGLAVTEELAERILDSLVANHDAEIGINWEVIDITTLDELEAERAKFFKIVTFQEACTAYEAGKEVYILYDNFTEALVEDQYDMLSLHMYGVNKNCKITVDKPRYYWYT